ncbi:MAG: hypothetical protein H6Q72_811 [Firmicutes bacterium]|nr:hypothetical protein [Bacillota bacterium]
MESLLVNGIGVAAIGYAGYLVWRNVNGKNGCSCGSGGSCPSGENCCSSKKSSQKLP